MDRDDYWWEQRCLSYARVRRVEFSVGENNEITWPGDAETWKLIQRAIEAIVEGWYRDTQIDWDDFLYRLECWTDCDFGGSMLSPAVKEVQRRAWAYKRLPN